MLIQAMQLWISLHVRRKLLRNSGCKEPLLLKKLKRKCLQRLVIKDQLPCVETAVYRISEYSSVSLIF